MTRNTEVYLTHDNKYNNPKQDITYLILYINIYRIYILYIYNLIYHDILDYLRLFQN